MRVIPPFPSRHEDVSIGLRLDTVTLKIRIIGAAELPGEILVSIELAGPASLTTFVDGTVVGNVCAFEQATIVEQFARAPRYCRATCAFVGASRGMPVVS